MESSCKFEEFMKKMNKKSIVDVKSDSTNDQEEVIEIQFLNRKLKGNKKLRSKGSAEQNQWKVASDNGSSDNDDNNDDNNDDDNDHVIIVNDSYNGSENDSDNDSDNDVKCVVETTEKTPLAETNALNAFEMAAENIECKVSVMDWIDNSTMKVEVRRFQPIAIIFKSVAEKHGLPPTAIELEYESVTLSETDSPHSIGYVMGTKIEASRKRKNATAPAAKQSQPDTNKINLRFRSSESRYPITLALNPSDPMKIAMAIACERFELDPKQVDFQFEGETIQFGDTAESLDMADDDVIDIEIR